MEVVAKHGPYPQRCAFDSGRAVSTPPIQRQSQKLVSLVLGPIRGQRVEKSEPKVRMGTIPNLVPKFDQDFALK
jgi:hypothetical protein